MNAYVPCAICGHRLACHIPAGMARSCYERSCSTGRAEICAVFVDVEKTCQQLGMIADGTLTLAPADLMRQLAKEALLLIRLYRAELERIRRIDTGVENVHAKRAERWRSLAIAMARAVAEGAAE